MTQKHEKQIFLSCVKQTFNGHHLPDTSASSVSIELRTRMSKMSAVYLGGQVRRGGRMTDISQFFSVIPGKCWVSFYISPRTLFFFILFPIHFLISSTKSYTIFQLICRPNELSLSLVFTRNGQRTVSQIISFLLCCYLSYRVKLVTVLSLLKI